MLTKSYFFISTIIFSLSLFAEPMNRSNQYLSAKKIVNNLCVACHAVDGNSAISMNPKLAGQHSAYITKQLMNFKSGTRENAVMAGMVASLNDEDMKNLGLYFSQQSLALSLAKSNGKSSLGEKIYRGGLSAKGVPACASCHGPAGHGIPDVYPRLNAQHSDYTLGQLNLFRLENRSNDEGMIMRVIAQKLTEKEMYAVSDYIEGLQ
ncbi:MAG TPA: cytochrome c4 [Methylophilaceae bacterium]|jgi:cytochrome c553|nr:cytochrome c4 [Methylophilaceae bacterium]|tara:strand:+ start:10393 stop:11013 length:621 start_codon:yes stop_codon:yes gene_type:complete